MGFLILGRLTVGAHSNILRHLVSDRMIIGQVGLNLPRYPARVNSVQSPGTAGKTIEVAGFGALSSTDGLHLVLREGTLSTTG